MHGFSPGTARLIRVGSRRLRPLGLLLAHDRQLGLDPLFFFFGEDSGISRRRHVMDRRIGRGGLRALGHIRKHDAVWITTGSAIVDWYKSKSLS